MPSKNIVIIRNAASYDFGGGERFPVFLAEVLASNDLKPVIISRSKKLLTFAGERNIKAVKGWWLSKQQWSGLNNIFIPVYFLWQVVLFFYYLVIFKKLSPAAVHIQSKDDFIAATYAASLLKINTVWTDHADLKHIWKNCTVPFKNPIGKAVIKAAKKANTITVVSKSELNLVKDNLSPDDPVVNKLKVIYNGVVDSSHIYKTATRTTDPFTFLVASRLVTDKGINEVLEAFTRLNKNNPNTQLILIGDGPEKDDFMNKSKNVGSINFMGHQSDPLGFMASANVFIHPTYHEGFSVALVEAGMMSMPIIATAVGGNVEIIEHGKTGLLAPVKNSDELYSEMLAIYKNESLQKSLGSNARKQYLKKFQFDQIIKNSFIPLYESSKGGK